MASPDVTARLEDLVTWSRSHGGAIHDAVAIVRDDTTGLSLWLKPQHQLQPQDTVVSCPLSTSLSYVSALGSGGPLVRPGGGGGEAAAFPDYFLQTTPPHVVGRFFLMQQYLLGRNSAWAPYIATLPQPEAFSTWALPAVWTNADAGTEDEAVSETTSRPDTARALARLAGTNAGTAAADMRGHLIAEFQQARAALECTSAGAASSAYTLSLYEWAYCIFTSRSFRPSLVLPPELQAATLQVMASTNFSPGDDGSSGGSSPKIDDFSILLPVLDLANHDPRAQVAWVPEILDPASPPLPTTQAATPVAPTAARISFVTRQPYAAGMQVFNNYGRKTNSELLLGYGFVLPPTVALHNDYVHLRRRADVDAEAAATAKGSIPVADFLLSLRPLDDPSSLVGAARQWPLSSAVKVPSDDGHRLPAGLAHFEDALLWDLCTRLWTDAEQKQLQAEQTEQAAATVHQGAEAAPVEAQRRAVLERVLGAEAEAGPGKGEEGDERKPHPYAALADRVRQTLLAKVGMDYERLVETDPYEDEEEDNENDNDDDDASAALVHVAETYREQYRAVLIKVLTALDPELEVVETS